MQKKIAIIASVTVVAILFWLTLIPWLKEGAGFQHVRVWLPPFISLSLLVGALSLGMILLERKRLWFLMTFLAGMPIFAIFGFHYIYFIFIGLLMVSVISAGHSIKRELAERYKVDIGVLSRAGVHYVIMPFLVGMSFIYFFSPQLQERARDGLFPQSFQRVIINGVQQSLDSSGMVPPGVDSRSAAAKAVEALFNRINAFLKPYQPYLPPLLAFGLFLILWGVAFLFRWFGALFARIIFYFLKRTGFVIIEERDVKAESIKL